MLVELCAIKGNHINNRTHWQRHMSCGQKIKTNKTKQQNIMKQSNALWVVILVFGLGLLANLAFHQKSEAAAPIAIPQHLSTDIVSP